MNLYKKFIPKKKRFAILRALKFIPDKQMIKFQYYVKIKGELNLKNPQRYTEKIQWYKLNYRNDDMPICVDKYRVREYIQRKCLDDILVKLYASYDKADDITLAYLPAVRVDLYFIEGKIYFGELTFFLWSGYVIYAPDSFDYEIGEKFILPEIGGYKQLVIVYIVIDAVCINKVSIDGTRIEEVIDNVCCNFREEVAA